MAVLYHPTTRNCVQVVEKLENGAKIAKNMLENGAVWCII